MTQLSGVSQVENKQPQRNCIRNVWELQGSPPSEHEVMSTIFALIDS